MRGVFQELLPIPTWASDTQGFFGGLFFFAEIHPRRRIGDLWAPHSEDKSISVLSRLSWFKPLSYAGRGRLHYSLWSVEALGFLTAGGDPFLQYVVLWSQLWEIWCLKHPAACLKSDNYASKHAVCFKKLEAFNDRYACRVNDTVSSLTKKSQTHKKNLMFILPGLILWHCLNWPHFLQVFLKEASPALCSPVCISVRYARHSDSSCL